METKENTAEIKVGRAKGNVTEIKIGKAKGNVTETKIGKAKENVTETKIRRAKYLTSAVKKEQYPMDGRPEIVFIGRSNVGKSSLINTLVNVHNLARVSKQPGKTQTINFFDVELIRGSDDVSFYLVDLPGYGYAKVGRSERRVWQQFITEYLLESKNIKFVCQLIDIRHDPMESDQKTFRWLMEHGIPVLIVATKTDKISKTAKTKNAERIKEVLGVDELDVLPFSSLKVEGRSELLDSIVTSLIE